LSKRSGPAADQGRLSAIFAHFEKNRVRVPVIAQVTNRNLGTIFNDTEISAALDGIARFRLT